LFVGKFFANDLLWFSHFTKTLELPTNLSRSLALAIPLRRLAVGASAAWAAPIAATVYEDGIILTSVFDARISWHHALILAVTIVGMVVIGRICVPALR